MMRESSLAETPPTVLAVPRRRYSTPVALFAAGMFLFMLNSSYLLDRNSMTSDESLLETTPRPTNVSQARTMTELTNHEYDSDTRNNSDYPHQDGPALMRSSLLNLTLEDRIVIDTRICHAPVLPQSPSSRCCMGAVSTGGIQGYRSDDGHTCQQDAATYDRLQALARHALEAAPVARSSPEGSWTLPCDLCRVVQLLSSSSFPHGRLSIVGDSLQTQLFTGLECELYRRGFQLSPTTTDTVRNPDPTDHRWRYGIKSKECFSVHVPPWMLVRRSANTDTTTNTSAAVQQDDDARRLSGERRKRRDRRRGTRRRRDSSSSPSPVHTHTNSTVEICNYKHFRPQLSMIQHQEVAEISDVMLIDYGLHYPLYVKGGRQTPQYSQKDADEYALSLQALLHMFRKSNCHLIYRQTSAQHFHNPNYGEYYKGVTKETTVNDTCRPHHNNNQSNSTTTLLVQGGVTIRERTALLHSAAVAEGFVIRDPAGKLFKGLENNHDNTTHDLTLVPFWDFSAQLFDQHPHGKDCTHLCYSPHLWSTTWRHVRNILERLAVDT